MAKKISRADVLAVMRSMAAKGGKNSRKNLPPAQARKLASKAAQARWARWRRDNNKPPKPGDAELLGEGN